MWQHQRRWLRTSDTGPVSGWVQHVWVLAEAKEAFLTRSTGTSKTQACSRAHYICACERYAVGDLHPPQELCMENSIADIANMSGYFLGSNTSLSLSLSLSECGQCSLDIRITRHIFIKSSLLVCGAKQSMHRATLALIRLINSLF